jgi:hypothetical protein
MLLPTTINMMIQMVLCGLEVCGLLFGPRTPLYTLAIPIATEKHLTGQATSSSLELQRCRRLRIVGICHVHGGILVLVIAAFVATYIPDLALLRKIATLTIRVGAPERCIIIRNTG